MSSPKCNGTPGRPGVVPNTVNQLTFSMRCPGCEACHGDCANCGGSGEYDYSTDPGTGLSPCPAYRPKEGSPENRATCKTCDGRGYIGNAWGNNTGPCPTCRPKESSDE